MKEGETASEEDGAADLRESGARRSSQDPAKGRSSELAAGVLLNDTYRVEKCIGRGAMGAVYLVEHVALRKKFAAKVVTGALAADPAAFVRLRNEARAASAIEHENIVNVTDLGQTDGVLFVVMELLRGEDLRARLETQRATSEPWLPDALAREIVDQVLSALDAAHAKGIVHRDLKPDNIFLTTRSDGGVRAKIVDFGISKLQQDEEDLRLTVTGQIIGTPLYMAPEQTRSGAPIDQRTDVYSMGIIAFEILTGKLPFAAANLFEIVLKHATEPAPSLRETRPRLPEAVERVVHKCLEKKPDDRFQSAAELREAWSKAWSEGIAPPRTIAEAPAKSFPRWPLLLIPAVAILAIASYAMWPRPEPVHIEPEVVEIPHELPQPAQPEPEPVPVEPEPAPIVVRTVRSTPPGATVLRDGAAIGVTPLAIELDEGEQASIELRLDGYRVEARTVSSSDPESIDVPLRRERVRPSPNILAPR